MAITFSNFNYLEASIHYNIKKCKDKDNLEEVVVHELCHILLTPCAKEDENVEYTVTTLARTLIGVRDAGKRKAK